MASPGSVVLNFIAKADRAARDVMGLSKAVDKLDDAAGDADDSLSDLQREIDKTGAKADSTKSDLDSMEKNLDSVGDEAERTADRLRKEAQNMATGLHAGAQDIDRETSKIKTDLGDAGKESGAEFISNLSEGIGSGTGSVSDVVQGTLGGLVQLASSLTGPVGIAAAAAATGIGLVFSKVKGESDKAKARVDALVDALIEVGNTSSQVAKDMIWDEWFAGIIKTPDLLEDITDGLRGAGIEGEVFQKAIEGDPVAQAEVLRKIKANGTAIADNVKKTGQVTPLQQKQIENNSKIIEQLGLQNTDLGNVNDILGDTEYLTGKNEKASNDWADEQNRVYNETHKIKNDLNDMPTNIPVNIIVTRKDKNGNPSHLGPGQLAVPGAPTTMAMPPQPVTVNVYATASSIPTTAREVVRLLEGHDVRMGRKPGAPRRRAW